MYTARTRFGWLLAAIVVLFFAACVPVEAPDQTGKEYVQGPSIQDERSVSEQRKAEQVPIEVKYFTPSQTEGPFYPVQKPDDRDSDLFVLEGATDRPAGEILEFSGTLYDGIGMPVSGAVVEIWQTDDNGIYLHPGDPNSSSRDLNFQSYGEAVTEENGHYTFRTIMPGGYEPRPRHIHVKVRVEGEVILTTQFYFSNDPEAAADRIFAGAGEDVEALIMEIEEGYDFEGNQALIGRRDIILQMNLSE